MKHLSYLCLAAALLAGCAAKPATWQKAGADEAIRSGDAQACSLQARTAPSPYPQAPVSAYGAPAALTVDERGQFEQARFSRCMEEKGYSAQR
jgi:hypothetical protein